MGMTLLVLALLTPWLHNLADPVEVEAGEPTESELAGWFDDEPECAPGAYTSLRLTADVAPTAGKETIVASLVAGMSVISSEGVELAAMPGYPCEGTADGIDVLSVGKVFGEPTIVLAITTGGHREQLTWLGVYRVGDHGRIDALFAGVIEQRVDGHVVSGDVTFIPGALLYHRPGGETSLWVFDPVAHSYLPRGPFGHEAEPHS